MTAEEKYGMDGAALNRWGNNRVITNMACKDDNSEEEKLADDQRRSSGDDDSRGLVFKRTVANIGGIGKMSEYAQTGIYIDPH